MPVIVRHGVFPEDRKYLDDICKHIPGLVEPGPGLYAEFCSDLSLLIMDDQQGPLGFASAVDDALQFSRWVASREPGGTSDYGDFLESYPAKMQIGVIPSARSRGYGKRLANAMVDILSQRGISGVHMVVDPQQRQSVNFCRVLGCKLIAWKEDRHYYGVGLSNS